MVELVRKPANDPATHPVRLASIIEFLGVFLALPRLMSGVNLLVFRAFLATVNHGFLLAAGVAAYTAAGNASGAFAVAAFCHFCGRAVFPEKVLRRNPTQDKRYWVDQTRSVASSSCFRRIEIYDDTSPSKFYFAAQRVSLLRSRRFGFDVSSLLGKSTQRGLVSSPLSRIAMCQGHS